MKLFSRLLLMTCLVGALGAGCFARRPVMREVSAPTVTISDDSSSDVDVEHSTSSIVATLLIDSGSTVTVHRADQDFAGENNMQLAYGDDVTVKTGTATLSYPETGMTRLEAGSAVTITIPAVDDGEGDTFFVRLDVTAGSIWTRLERLLGPTEAFQASGNSVVATVRGTAFSFGVSGEDVDVSVADHEVELSSDEDPTSVVRMKPGERFRAKLADMRAARGITTDVMRKRFVQTMTTLERNKPAFKAMQVKVREDLMQRPDRPVFLPIKPRINMKMLERLTPEQRQKFLRRMRMTVEQAKIIQQRIVPNPLLPLPLQLIRIATSTR